MDPLFFSSFGGLLWDDEELPVFFHIWLVPTTLSWPPYCWIARFTPGNGLPVARDPPPHFSHLWHKNPMLNTASPTGFSVAADGRFSDDSSICLLLIATPICKHKWSSLMIYRVTTSIFAKLIHQLFNAEIGILDYRNSDGRLIFFLWWCPILQQITTF